MATTRTGSDTSRIPTFRSIEDAAEFWDTHDSAEFEDGFEDVTDVKFVRVVPKHAVTVQLDEETIAVLTKRALEQRIGVSSLVRGWILDRLRARADNQSDSRPD